MASRPEQEARRVTKLVRLLGAAVLVVLAIRILDWLLAPVLPLLVSLLVMTLVAYVVLSGRRGL
jgi:uncharacterized membrane protein